MGRVIWLFLLAVAISAAALGGSEMDTPSPDRAINDVLNRYRLAVEAMDPSAAQPLFAADSTIVENGVLLGSFGNYLSRELRPQLSQYRSIRFLAREVQVRREGQVALARETYFLRAEPRSGAVVEHRGATTTVLREGRAGWKIVSQHISAERHPGGTDG